MSAELVSPSLVPVGLLIRLAKAGLGTTDKVHAAITKGELQKYKGIGPYTEQRILHYYTRREHEQKQDANNSQGPP